MTGWTARTRQPGFRQLAAETLRLNAPAHLSARVLWLEDFESTRRFEAAYQAWRKALAAPNTTPNTTPNATTGTTPPPPSRPAGPTSKDTSEPAPTSNTHAASDALAECMRDLWPHLTPPAA